MVVGLAAGGEICHRCVIYDIYNLSFRSTQIATKVSYVNQNVL